MSVSMCPSQSLEAGWHICEKMCTTTSYLIVEVATVIY